MEIKRQELKSYFVTNAIPTQSNFEDLIDSALNQKEDGLVKLPGEPLRIEAVGSEASEKRVLHLSETASDPDAAWVLSLRPTNPSTSQPNPGLSFGGRNGPSRLFIERSTGNVGVGTVKPEARLHVANDAIIDGNLQVRGAIAVEAWRTLPLEPKFTAYLGGFAPPSYCKDSMGFVHLRGLLKFVGSEASATHTLLSTLDAGYRPELQYVFPMVMNSTVGRIDVAVGGQIYIYSAFAAGGFLSLDGITFKAAQ